MNDQVTGERFHVLAVCVGNVCRSPFLERLLAARAAAHGVELVTSSAGVGAVVGGAIHPYEREELASRGVDPDDFAARQLTSDLLANADLVLTATRQVRTEALQLHPGALRRTFTLTEAAAIADGGLVSSAPGSLKNWVQEAARHRAAVTGFNYDVADPIGRDRALHAQVATEIEQAVKTLVKAWSREA